SSLSLGRRACEVRDLFSSVFAAQLRRDRIEAFFLTLETRFAAPGPLQAIADGEGEPAETIDLKLDAIAILEGMQPAVVGSAGEDVAGLERVQGACPLDAARNLVSHVRRIEVLPKRTVVPETHLQLVGILDLILCDEPGSDRREGVARLHLEEHIVWRR